MATRFKQSIVLLLLLLGTMFPANGNAENIPENTPTAVQESSCTLPAPSVFLVTNVGTNWASLSWTPVSGAFQYHIVTREFPSGTLLHSMYVSAAFNSATIAPLPPGTMCQSEIWSVCQNGVDGPASRLTPVYGTPIIDLVECGLWGTDGLTQNSCVMGSGWVNGCDISNTDNVGTAFRISDESNNPSNFRYFRVSKEGSVLHVIPHPYTNGNISFEFSGASGGGEIEVKKAGVSSGFFSTNSPTAGGSKRLYWTSGPSNRVFIRKMNGTVPGNCAPEGLIFDGSWGQSIEDYDQHLSVAPNPFTNFLDIKIPFAAEENELLISLYDLQGRLVMSVRTPGGSQTQSISTHDLPPGLYLLRADTGDKSETIKVLKTQ